MNRASRYLANVTLLTFVRVVVFAFCICLCYHATPSEGKVFDRCELAQLLRYGHGLDVNDVANWVCIAQHSSSLNTSAFGGNAGSGSHGIFQISDQYWCSPPGKGVACGLTCDRLRDDDISDDFGCVQVIFQEHQRLSGDGYNAWVAYQQYCRENPYEYVEDCFGEEEQEYLHSKSITANSVQYDDDDDGEEEEYGYSKKRGKVYKRCELAKELFLRHKMPMEEIPTWVCIAQHESNYNTAAVGRLNTDGSADHGLFQISDLYWCSHKGGRRKACGLPCSKLLDSDIADDMKCVKQIYEEHTRISGDGFTAWTVYNAYCQGQTENYIRGCFDGIDVVSESKMYEEYQKPLKSGKLVKPHGKVYEPCELAEELRTKHRLPEDQIATWVCIAKHESDYNTSAIGYGDHGLFQISDIYWCSPPGKGWACGLSCKDLEDSDISDDVECIRKIHAEHTHLSGDGFNAWTVYPQYCSDGKSEKYISHCPRAGKRPAVTSPPQTHSQQISANSIEDYEPKSGKIYGRCELANELLTKYAMSMEEIPTWVCIAHHESNFDTSAVGRRNTDGSADHGLFQISDIYWCSHKGGHRKACGLPCSKLLDNDISDDMKCVKQIYDEHTRISGDGFTAWTVYGAYCKERTEQYVQGCFDGSALPEDFKPAPRTIEHEHVSKNKPKGKIYEECELAAELRDKYRMPKDEIATWVCIAKYQSGLNTSSAVSNVHGLFHISDEFWCSPPGKGQVCELHCSDLEDSDISDDIECVRKIYLEHQKLFGDGFNAWVVYPQYCSDGKADEYISHCHGFKKTTANAISHEVQNGVIRVHPKLGGGSIEISSKPVYSHVFDTNPFLRHFETVNSFPASTVYSNSEPYFSASEEVEEVVSASHEFSLNPFLKRISADKEKPIEAPIKTTTVLLPAFHDIPIAPTPTTLDRVTTYDPENEEKAKYDIFKALANPNLPPITNTPRANRLQTYQLNTFKAITTPTLTTTTTPSSTTNRLQPYQLNTFKFIGLSTPTILPLSTKTTTMKPIILSTQPTVRSSTNPISIPTKAPQVSKDFGQYNAGKYDSGRYNSGKYSQPKKPSPVFSSTTNASSPTKEHPSAQNSGQYPGPRSTLPSETTYNTQITSTNQYLGKSVIAATKTSPQTSPTRMTPTSPKSILKPFSTLRPITTSTVTQIGQYVQPTANRHSGQYVPYKKSPASSPPSTASSNIRATNPTKKFDPFKPFTPGSYNPFKVFNTGKQNSSSSFSFLSEKITSINSLDFAPSSNSKRETASSSRNSVKSIQKSAVISTTPVISKTTTKPQVTATPTAPNLKAVTTSNKSIKSISAVSAKPTRSTSTTTTAVKTQKPDLTKASGISSKSVPTISPTRVVETQKPSGISVTTRSVAATTPTRSLDTHKPSPTTRSVSSSRFATTISPTRSVVTQKPSRTSSPKTSTTTRSVLNSRPVPATTSTRSHAISPIAAITKSLVGNSATRPTPPITEKPTINSAPPTRSTATIRKTRSLSPSSTISSTTATTISPQHVVPTRTEFQKSSTPKLTTTLKTTTTGSSTRTPATSASPTSKTTQIRPTKTQHSSDILFSTKLFDLYYKLYGVHVHPPMETSSGVQQVTKTSQTNVVPSRTS